GGFDAVVLANEAFQSADGHRSVNHSAPALVLARRGADPAADGSKRIRRPRGEVGFFVPSLTDQLNIPAAVGADRTSRLARDHPLPEFEVGHKSAVSAVVVHDFLGPLSGV